MACNCNEEGKVINIGIGCCQQIVANADKNYTKSEDNEMNSNMKREIET